MAHFELGNLDDNRKFLCGTGSGDEETKRRAQAEYERICPEDKFSDPFIVAVMIALAQQQRLFIDSQSPKPDPKGKMPGYMSAQRICDAYQSRSFLVHVFVTYREAPGFHVYKANVPIQLLDRLADPGRFSHSGRMIVNHHRINLRAPTAVLDELSRVLGLPIDQPPLRNIGSMGKRK
ncbi:hypothetical protein Neosp_003451 [[Neocosmospora] mangrovei]